MQLLTTTVEYGNILPIQSEDRIEHQGPDRTTDVVRSPKVSNPKVMNWRSPSAYSASRNGHIRVDYEGRGTSFETNSYYQWINSQYSYSGEFYAPIPADLTSYWQRMENSRMRALNKLSDEKLHLPLALAEMHKSVKMVSDLAFGVMNGLGRIAEKDKKAFQYLLNGFSEKRLNQTHSGQKMLKRITSSYLMYKYGVQPLVMDLAGVASVKKKGLFGAPLIAGKSNQRYVDFIDVSLLTNIVRSSAISDFYESLPKTVKVKVTTDYKTAIYAVTTNDQADYYRAMNGLGLNLSSAATLAWDLAPFSFIIDHIMPMADIIKSQSAMQGLTEKSATTTVFQRYELVDTTTFALAPSPTTQTRGQKYHSSKKWTFSGYGSISLPKDRFSMNRTLIKTHGALPHYVSPFKVSNVATWVALGHTLTSK